MRIIVRGVSIDVRPLIVFVVFIGGIVWILRRERRRRLSENIPPGFAGFVADFRSASGDRVAVLALIAAYVGAQWIRGTFAGRMSEVVNVSLDYGLTVVLIAVIAWFVFRRKEFERLLTYRAGFVALCIVGGFTFFASLFHALEVVSTQPSVDAVGSIALWSFLLSYVLLKRRLT